MPAVPPNLLTPLEYSKASLTLNAANDAYTFVLNGAYDYVVPQLWCESDASWPASAVVSVQCSQNSYAWSAFPTAIPGYTGNGVQNAIAVTGINYIRFYVSTAGGSATAMRLFLAGVKRV
jgi:hypothetical protein